MGMSMKKNEETMQPSKPKLQNTKSTLTKSSLDYMLESTPSVGKSSKNANVEELEEMSESLSNGNDMLDSKVLTCNYRE